MSIDYSQFYAGTSSIPAYGNSSYKKDTLVKYQFNTTDKDGNKVMDKMSKEETIQAMKEIRSQYGDNVIVEFSGDGMVALVENRKGQLDEMMTDKERAAKAEKDAAFTKEIVQNEHIEVAPEHMQGRTDYVKIMHEMSPETAEKVDNYMREFSRTQDKTYLEKAVKLSFDWFRENYIGQKNSSSVLLSVEDSEETDSVDKKDAGNKTGHSIGSISFGAAMNHDGTATLFAELMNKAKEKKAFLYASSVNELFGKVEKFDWSAIRAEIENKIVFKDF